MEGWEREMEARRDTSKAGGYSDHFSVKQLVLLDLRLKPGDSVYAHSQQGPLRHYLQPSKSSVR